MTAALCIDGPKKGEVLAVHSGAMAVQVPVLPPARWGTLGDLDPNRQDVPVDPVTFERFAYHVHRLHLFGRRVDVLSGRALGDPALDVIAAQALLTPAAFALWQAGERRP